MELGNEVGGAATEEIDASSILGIVKRKGGVDLWVMSGGGGGGGFLVHCGKMEGEGL
ncbi:unnamed protein product, partial [Dovyalis caffra]